MSVHWTVSRFAALSAADVFDLLELRSRVFVVEQQCVYQDPTPEDRHAETRHVLGRSPQGELIAYARLLAPGVDGPEVAIGRVVTDDARRGQGLGHALLQRCLEAIDRVWPTEPVHLHAQVYLLDFYHAHGFRVVGEPYPLDGIEHQDMRREGARETQPELG